MSNYLLKTDQKIAVTTALAEGSSIRSVERMTGIHLDTIMRLGVKIGQGCAHSLDEKMRHVKEGDDPTFGDVWTHCALDAETKLVPSYHVSSKRDLENTAAFISDLASRLNNRVQISTDAMVCYPETIEFAFGREVDYAQRKFWSYGDLVEAVS